MRGVDASHHVHFLKVLYHGQCRLIVSIDALHERLFVVVAATGRLAAIQASLNSNFIGALEEEHESDVSAFAHLSRPAVEIVLVARKSVDKERVLAALAHRILQESARDLDGHDAAALDVPLDLLAHFGARSLTLGSKQVTG